MGKHEPMTAKAIANKIKAKGLQKVKYYCTMCEKQCRDDNGFKCHIQSDAHQRQALIVSQNPHQFVNEFSQQFLESYMYILKVRYRTKRVLANTVYQDYIKDRDHIHLNATRWTSLTEFAEWLGENGYVKTDSSERGIMITLIDRDPETLRRQELEAKRAEQAVEDAIKKQKEIDRQMEMTKKIYEEKVKDKPVAKPIPIVKVCVNSGLKESSEDVAASALPTCITALKETSTERSEVIEKPLFNIQSVSLKTLAPSSFKPPAPKRKVTIKSDAKKKMKP